MSEQVMYYKPGIHIWAKLVNKVWWPGKVVHRSSIPNQLQYSLNKKKTVKTYVYFGTDDTYITVFNENNVCSYSFANKLQYVKKGYSLYLKQIKNDNICCFDMTQFIETVQQFENELGGDPNIFDQFVIKTEQTYPTINIKELFMTEKRRKKNKKLVAAKTQIGHPRKINNSLPVTKKQVARRTQKDKESLPPKEVKKSTMKTTTYGCYLNLGCDFVTYRYDALIRHVRIHLDEKKKKEDAIAKTGNNTVFKKPLAISTPKINAIQKYVYNAEDSLTVEMFTDKNDKPLDSKTNDDTQHNTMVNGTNVDEDECTMDDEYNDTEEMYLVNKHVNDWLQKKQGIMKEVEHTPQQDAEHADLDVTVNQKEKTLAHSLSDSCTNYVWAPIIESDEVYTDEELFAMPVIQELRRQIENGEPHNASVTIKGAKILPGDSSLIPFYPLAYCPNPHSMVLPIEDDSRLIFEPFTYFLASIL